MNKILNSTSSSPDLSEAIFAVIPSVMQTIRHEMRSAVQDLTIPQFRILARLSKGATTHCHLADWIGVSLPAISRMVNLLEDRNLVQRDRQEKDRRYVNLNLTTEGSAFFKRCKNVGQRSLSKRFEGMSDDDKNRIVEALKLLGSALEQMEEGHEETCGDTRYSESLGMRT